MLLNYRLDRMLVVVAARKAFDGDSATFCFILASGVIFLRWPYTRLPTAACMIGSRACGCVVRACRWKVQPDAACLQPPLVAIATVDFAAAY